MLVKINTIKRSFATLTEKPWKPFCILLLSIIAPPILLAISKTAISSPYQLSGYYIDYFGKLMFWLAIIGWLTGTIIGFSKNAKQGFDYLIKAIFLFVIFCVFSIISSLLINIFFGGINRPYDSLYSHSRKTWFILAKDPIPTDTCYQICSAKNTLLNPAWQNTFNKNILDYSEDGSLTSNPQLILSGDEKILVVKRGGELVDAIDLSSGKNLVAMVPWNSENREALWQERTKTISKILAEHFRPIASSPKKVEKSMTEISKDPKIITQTDIVYGRGSDETLMLDMFRPESGRPLPVIIFIHGGGWCIGRRNDMHSHAIHAANKGFATVCVSYRLAAETDNGKYIHQFPAQIHDVKCAVRWVRAHVKEYNFDPNRIAAIGHSAGGHLSLMLATTAGDEFFEGDGGWSEYSSNVQAAVSWAGSTDLVELYPILLPDVAPFAVKFLGGTLEEVPQRYKAASPTSYISKNTSPILLVHGDQDDNVFPSQSLLMRQKLEEAGIKNELLYLKGQGHSYDDEAMKIIRQTQYEFIRKYLK